MLTKDKLQSYRSSAQLHTLSALQSNDLTDLLDAVETLTEAMERCLGKPCECCDRGFDEMPCTCLDDEPFYEIIPKALAKVYGQVAK